VTGLLFIFSLRIEGIAPDVTSLWIFPDIFISEQHEELKVSCSGFRQNTVVHGDWMRLGGFLYSEVAEIRRRGRSDMISGR